jgi:hypothetical protein
MLSLKIKIWLNSFSDYLPDTREMKADTGSLDEELDSDFKKQCVLM